jgi:hypothetical protein
MLTNVRTYTNARLQPAQYPHLAQHNAGVFGPSLTIVAGQALGKKTADGKLYAYADANSDGTQACVGYSIYSFVTDANGQAFIGGSTTPGEDNPPQTTMPYYWAGVFDTADLTGHDAAALADLKGFVMPSGFIKIG